MAYILNIDTSTETAVISISKNGKILSHSENANLKDHAAFIHMAITDLLLKTKTSIKDIKAIAVTSGPGSYTGIRVGMASAKGMSFALDIPFIMINSLELLAFAASLLFPGEKYKFAPVIDARRMEVYTALYDYNLNVIIQPLASILNNKSFTDYLENEKLVFVGSGIAKLRGILNHPGAIYVEKISTVNAIGIFSFNKYIHKLFDDRILSEPLYLKDLHTL